MTTPMPEELIESQYRKLRMAFEPATAAIVGASSDPKKFGGRALKFCLERQFRGTLYPVNANADEVQGVRAYRSIADLPQAPDITVIAVPAPLVLESLVAAGERGTGIAIVYGAMFAESGEEGRARQQELVAVARHHGMRLIGPNCMGVISLRSGFVASFTTAPEHHGGNGWPELGSVSVVSQSGAVGIQMFAQLRDRGLGLANWISTGNQADIDVADCIAYFAEDAATRTIAVYMEDASRGLKLMQALEKARVARKPVVILKVGTTPEGGFAAAGHTAAMYVEDRVIDNLFRQYGVLRARSVNELIDLVAACNSAVVPSSPEVAAISVSGGGAVMISDAAARHGLVLPEYDRQSLRALKETNSFVNDRNPIDISAPSMSDMAITAGHLEFGLAQPMPTMVGYISHIPLVPRTRKEIMPRLVALGQKYRHKLIAIAMNADAQDRKELVRSGIAVFDDPVVAWPGLRKTATDALGRSPARRRQQRQRRRIAGRVRDCNGPGAQLGHGRRRHCVPPRQRRSDRPEAFRPDTSPPDRDRRRPAGPGQCHDGTAGFRRAGGDSFRSAGRASGAADSRLPNDRGRSRDPHRGAQRPAFRPAGVPGQWRHAGGTDRRHRVPP